MTIGGHLELNPGVDSVIRLAGEEQSFFLSCIPFSTIGPVGDSRIRAKELRWEKKQIQPHQSGWVTMGSHAHDRVHVEQSADGRGLDLVFRSVQVSDHGEYACRATLDGREEAKKVRLDVIEPITFSNTPSVQVVEEGAEEFVLICQVTGNPRPNVSWNVRGQLVKPGELKYSVSDQGLVIRNISKQDKGHYKCKATQLGKDSYSDFKDLLIELKVEHPPEWATSQRSHFYGFISGSANLTCEAIAEPPATFVWLTKNQQEVNFGQIITQKSSTTLVLDISHDTLFGSYTCIAQNKMGSISRTVTLLEGAKPGIPSIRVNKVGHSFVDLIIQEHKAELYLEITGFRIEFTEKNESWSQASTLFFFKSVTMHYVIESLTPKTFYFIRVRAQNLAGVSDASNIIYLQTSAQHSVEELVSGTTKNVFSSLAAVISSSILINWALF